MTSRPEHDAEKWVPVFGKTSCSNKKSERDDDLKISHPALRPNLPILVGGQTLTTEFGWRAGVIGFAALALGILPAAFFAGRVDRAAPVSAAADQAGATSIATAISTALRTPAFVVMAGAYFVCGMQLLFITTHLPSYLALCGMDPMLSA